MFYNNASNYITDAGTLFYKTHEGFFSYERPFAFPDQETKGLGNHWKTLEHSTKEIDAYKREIITIHTSWPCRNYGTTIANFPCSFQVFNLPALNGTWAIAEARRNPREVFDRIEFIPNSQDKTTGNFIALEHLWGEVLTHSTHEIGHVPAETPDTLPNELTEAIKAGPLPVHNWNPYH